MTSVVMAMLLSRLAEECACAESREHSDDETRRARGLFLALCDMYEIPPVLRPMAELPVPVRAREVRCASWSLTDKEKS